MLAIGLSNNTQATLQDKSLMGSIHDACSSIKPVSWVEKYIANPMGRALISITGQGEALASEEYQALVKEAQDSLEIPQDKRTQVRKIAPTSMMTEQVPVTCLIDNAIYFNEKVLAGKPFGVKRSAAFIESINLKYNYMGAQALVSIGNLAAMVGLICKISKLQTHQAVKYLGAVGVVLGIYLIDIKQSCYCTQRTDIEGHYATKCYHCVEESAAFRQQLIEQTNFYNKQYVLHKVSLDEIAQDLKNQNLACSYHQAKQ